MLKKLGLVAAGIVVGVVLTEILIEQEKKAAEGADNEAEKRSGHFAEICGNKVRMYEVKDGSFCGYSETREFESRDKAIEWVVKETDAKMVFKEDDGQ
ncbi:MAG: hypothetical protein Q4D81_03460 [Eubacteriales bacterium]|nr:hypothetical protein [Eubacteriales bacterium]